MRCLPFEGAVSHPFPWASPEPFPDAGLFIVLPSPPAEQQPAEDQQHAEDQQQLLAAGTVNQNDPANNNDGNIDDAQMLKFYREMTIGVWNDGSRRRFPLSPTNQNIRKRAKSMES